MADLNFIRQRIAIYGGKDIDPNADLQVKDLLMNMGIRLPQRRDLNDSLQSCNEEHEVIKLISKYRKLSV